jgi:MFS family permease
MRTATAWEELRGGYRVVLAALIGASLGVAGITTYTLPFFVDSLHAEFGWSKIAITGAAPCVAIALFFASPWTGRLCDRIGTRRLTCSSIVLFALGLASMSLMRGHIIWLYMSYFFTCVLGAGTLYNISSRAINSWFDRARGLALGLTTCGPGVAVALTPQFLPTVISSYGWRVGYLVLAAAALLALLPAWFWLSERCVSDRRVENPKVGIPFRDIRVSRRFWQMIIGILLVEIATTGAIIHNLPMLRALGATDRSARDVVSLFGIALIGGRILTGVLLDRLPGALVGAGLFSAPVLGVIAYAKLGAGGGWIFALALGLAAGAEGDLVAFLVSRYFGLKSYGEANGWIFGVGALGAALGPPLVASIFAVGGDYALVRVIWAVLCLAAAALFGTLGRYPAQAQG